LKKIVIITLILIAVPSIYVLNDSEQIVSTPRSPASIPGNYESLSGCEKQDILWNQIETSAYRDLPAFNKFGLSQIIKMAFQELAIKGDRLSDIAPDGWKKYLHPHGVVAKIEIQSVSGNYTGIFKGAECALLRLSLTYRPEGARPVAPGLALKVLRDQTHSANVSALVSLDGQEKDFNFFKYPMSNIVPRGLGIGQKLIHRVFRKVTTYPEELVLEDMAAIDHRGIREKNIISPRQMFFVPHEGLNFSSEQHEVRTDLMTISEGTLLYKIYIVPDKYKNFDYSQYTNEKKAEFLKEAEHVANIVTTSRFIASEFGDRGIFFRHQIRP
jgi:hypothetical protein